MNSYDESLGTRARRFLSEMFGVRGSKNLVSWVLAGGAAYYLFYLPEKQRLQEIQVGCVWGVSSTLGQPLGSSPYICSIQ